LIQAGLAAHTYLPASPLEDSEEFEIGSAPSADDLAAADDETAQLSNSAMPDSAAIAATAKAEALASDDQSYQEEESVIAPQEASLSAAYAQDQLQDQQLQVWDNLISGAGYNPMQQWYAPPQWEQNYFSGVADYTGLDLSFAESPQFMDVADQGRDILTLIANVASGIPVVDAFAIPVSIGLNALNGYANGASTKSIVTSSGIQSVLAYGPSAILGMGGLIGGTAADSAPLGDLTAEEQAQIQQAVNNANRPINVVGSAAKGTRGPGSDIDYTAPSSSHGNFAGQELPGVNPVRGILYGAPDPYQGPSIRFEPNAPPTFIPQKG
jgi:hypothetical protein